MLLNCCVREDSWESLGLQGDPTSQSSRKSVLNIHWKDWCWRWNSNTLATWCKELTHWKRQWCWERLKVGKEGDDRGWDGWMISPIQWTWVWTSSRIGDGQGSLVCYSPWGHKELDTTERLNWTDAFIELNRQPVLHFRCAGTDKTLLNQTPDRFLWTRLGCILEHSSKV